MKMNKLAAGALALALGLGAVAPSLAVEAKSGTELTAEAYNEQLAKANKFYLKRKEAAEAVKAAKARVKAAEKAVEVAEKAYKDAKDDKKDEAVTAAKDAYDKALKAEMEAKTKAEKDGATDEDKKAYTKAQEATKEAKKEYDFLNRQKPSYFLQGEAFGLKRELVEQSDKVATARNAWADEKDEKEKAKKKATLEKEEAALLLANSKYEEKVAEVAKAIEKEKLEEDNLIVTEKLSPKKQALVDLVKAQNELSAANGAYGIAVATEKAAEKRYDDEYRDLTAKAVASGAIVKIENDKIVVKPAVKDEKEFKKDNITELKRAREEALTAIKAVKLLKELSPEKIKNVEAKLNALVAKNEELVKKADAKIAAAEKKMAFIATAYADEEADDTDALIKELDSTTSEIKELIKDKPEEKKEEEKKPEEKKEEKTPSKKAGNNARTGIAGVAGVAGILAAASVAYAASKRD